MALVLYNSNFHDVEKKLLLFGVKLRFTSEAKPKDALKRYHVPRYFVVCLTILAK